MRTDENLTMEELPANIKDVPDGFELIPRAALDRPLPEGALSLCILGECYEWRPALNIGLVPTDDRETHVFARPVKR